ncbi:Lrp/AsnC family transcriptional regulator [Pedobacter xixiisoli]|uniref:DNA-binding transcriptional regulator, Lrp family n=1 Tax=Pedobacter xixiisoli TaxID=1476464 RepID=A0A286AAR7_9SPHI|nr:Lrp/AsnC family transcriptional regulator [Pedobacter xixiisoli]SOD18994.1 DNA-binding transcriptional regulator, Lrp family [Pedobacter xixiisoli]
MTELDSFDISILNLLQADNFTPQRDIGDKIGLSAAAVQRRIKRLTDTGFIVSNTSVLNSQKLGNLITICVTVAMENEKIESIDEAKSLFKSCPEVQQCYYVTGDTDFILIVVEPSMHHYEQLCRRLFFANPNIKRFRSFIATDLVKIGSKITLDHLKAPKRK